MKLPSKLIFWGAWIGCYAMGMWNGALLSETISLTVFVGGLAVYVACNAVAIILHQRDHKRFMREMGDAERRIDAARERFDADLARSIVN